MGRDRLDDVRDFRHAVQPLVGTGVGNDAVELASVTRRTLAKLIDVALITVPMQVAIRVVIGSAEDLKIWSEKLAAWV